MRRSSARGAQEIRRLQRLRPDAKPQLNFIVDLKRRFGFNRDSYAVPHGYLVKAPRECIDYVISHELCHLQEHNHSPRYYRLLAKLMPSWEGVKDRLDGMAELLLNE